MPDFAPDAFTIFGNFNKDQKKDGHYWAQMDVPVDELRKLFEWAKTAERCDDIKGNECVKLRANLMPRIKVKRQRLSDDGFERCQASYS